MFCQELANTKTKKGNLKKKLKKEDRERNDDVSVTKKRNDDVHSFRFYKIKQRWRLIYKKGYIPPNNHKKRESKVRI